MPGPKVEYGEMPYKKGNIDDLFDTFFDIVSDESELEDTYGSSYKEKAKSELVVMDSTGKIYTDYSQLEETLKEKELYFYLPGTKNFRAVQATEKGLEITTRDLEADDFVELPKEPEKKVHMTGSLDGGFDTLAADKEAIDNGTIGNLNIDEISGNNKRLTDEEIVLISQGKIKIKEPEWPTLLDGVEKTENNKDKAPLDVNDPAAESFLPKEPKPLTGAQKFFDGFVKIFNRKGSAAGRAFREQERMRNDAKTNYSDWAKNYNKSIDEYYVAVEQKNRFKTYQAEQKAEREYYTEQMKYSTTKRELFAKNPMAGIADIIQNGITRENVGTYSNLIANQLDTTQVTKDNLEEVYNLQAEYIIVDKFNKQVAETNAKNIKYANANEKAQAKAEAGGYTDIKKRENDTRAIRDIASEARDIDNLNNDKKHAAMLNQVKNSEPFKDTINMLKETPEDLEKVNQMDGAQQQPLSKRVDAAVKKTFDAPPDYRKNLERLKKSIIEDMGKTRVGEKTEEYLVKLNMIEKAKAEVAKAPSDRSTFDKVARPLNVDYAKAKKRYQEMLEKDPGIKERSAEKKDKKERSAEEMEFRELTSNLKKYGDVLKSEPAIQKTVKDMKGMKLPGEAINGMYLGNKKQMEAEKQAERKSEHNIAM